MTKGTPSNLRSYLQLHLVILIWGFTAILGLLITISPLAMVFFRTSLTALGLAVVVLVRKKNLRIPRRDLFLMGLAGGLLASHWILFFLSARVSTASVCLAGMSTTSLWTSFIEPIITKRKINWIEVLLGSFAIAGLYIIFRFEIDHVEGIILSLAAAILAALFTITKSHLSKRQDASVITFYEMCSASVITSVFVLLTSIVQNETAPFWPTGVNDWMWILLLSMVCTVYPYIAVTKIMKHFSAYMINLTVNLEPIYGIILAYLIFGEKEKMTSGFYLGTTIILSTVFLYPLLKKTFKTT
jgi:drug/metabolite transporter (DMT)-like permease